jgi:hypothetical protein
MDSISTRSIKSLGIDVANLTSRLAVNTSVIEEIIELASTIDQNSWVHQQLTDEGGEPSGEYATTLPGAETDKVQALLAFIGSLQ